MVIPPLTPWSSMSAVKLIVAEELLRATPRPAAPEHWIAFAAALLKVIVPPVTAAIRIAAKFVFVIVPV